jgi:hypothetical protein
MRVPDVMGAFAPQRNEMAVTGDVLLWTVPLHIPAVTVVPELHSTLDLYAVCVNPTGQRRLTTDRLFFLHSASLVSVPLAAEIDPALL